MRSAPLPLSLITGFLGSGKTTLLAHLLRGQVPDRPLLVLVNEFSRIEIDGERLRSESAHVVSLPGGSLFCRCLVTEFVQALRGLAARAQNAEPPFAGLVVEASGMANPKAIERVLAETGLEGAFRLSSIVTVVDPASFRKLRLTLPNLVDQVEAADVILVNKIDCASPALVEETDHQLRALNARAAIHRTAYAAIDLSLFPATSKARGLSGDYARCSDPRFTVLDITSRSRLDPPLLRQAIERCGDGIHRAKGSILTAQGLCELDYSASGWSLKPIEHPGHPTEALVFFIQAEARSRVSREVIDPLRDGRFNLPADPSPEAGPRPGGPAERRGTR